MIVFTQGEKVRNRFGFHIVWTFVWLIFIFSHFTVNCLFFMLLGLFLLLTFEISIKTDFTREQQISNKILVRSACV